MTDGQAVLTQRIRFALSQLRAQNGHHEFEQLCWQVARAPSSGFSGRRLLLLVGLTTGIAALVTVLISTGKAPGTQSRTSPNASPIRPAVVGSSAPAATHHAPATLLSGLAEKTWQGRIYADPAIAHGADSVSQPVADRGAADGRSLTMRHGDPRSKKYTAAASFPPARQ